MNVAALLIDAMLGCVWLFIWCSESNENGVSYFCLVLKLDINVSIRHGVFFVIVAAYCIVY